MDSQKYELYANNILIVTRLGKTFWHIIVEQLTRQEQVQDNGFCFRQELVQFLQSGSVVPISIWNKGGGAWKEFSSRCPSATLHWMPGETSNCSDGTCGMERCRGALWARVERGIVDGESCWRSVVHSIGWGPVPETSHQTPFQSHQTPFRRMNSLRRN